MHPLLILVLIGCSSMLICGRPQPEEENDERDNREETEYNGYGAIVDDSARNNENANEDNEFSEYNSGEKRRFHDQNLDDNVTLENTESKYKLFSKQSNRIIDNNESSYQEDPARKITNNNIDNDNDNIQNEDEETLFPNSRELNDKIEKSDDESSDLKEQSSPLKQYYNDLKEENKIVDDKNAQDSFSRNRREVPDSNVKEEAVLMASTSSKVEYGNSANNVGEELAIKRHIRKLSSQELEELLNSLSDDKKSLLRKIIDSDTVNNSDNINKREITKKAGAIEENYLESGDASKIEGGNTAIEAESSLSQNIETTVTNKHETQTENSDLKNTKTAEIVNSENKFDNSGNAKLASTAAEIFASKASTMLPETVSKSEQNVVSKTYNKRETNINDFVNSEMRDTKMLENNSVQNINSQGCFCSEDDNLSQLLDDESQSHNDRKREAFIDQYADVSDSIKALDESFPNSNMYDESNSYYRSNMAPLIRVKRNTQSGLKKRAVDLSSNAKQDYCPYRAENDDEDSDEGNELSDDGFYDHTSNFEKSNDGDINDSLKDDKKLNDPNDFDAPSPKSKPTVDFISQSNIEHSKVAKNYGLDTMSLGSDTDNVLSGVEGVDENLMFSNLRYKRTASDETKEYDHFSSTPVIDVASENIMNGPNYQESEAFGPLPRNYEGELNRYKRIRHAKLSNSDKLTGSSY